MRFYVCDVFTDRQFGGNQLAVVPEAEGLSDAVMQQIAREFNFAETTFVFAPEHGHTRRVRIFTPAREVPFAGHPNIGTAFALATTGALGQLEPVTRVTFEEQAGLVPITIDQTAGTVRCELSAPERLSLGITFTADQVAAAVSLASHEVLTSAHPPQLASVGLPFIVAELASRGALARARVNLAGFDALKAAGVMPDIHLYVRSGDGFDLRARMFAPLDGVPEDPATGSANCALAGLLAHLDPRRDGQLSWRIAQGVEMGRPSVLYAAAVKAGGAVVEARVAGDCVMFAEGTLRVDARGTGRTGNGRQGTGDEADRRH